MYTWATVFSFFSMDGTLNKDRWSGCRLCIKPDSSLTGGMHHHTSWRKMLCCVYKCLPSSWFLNLGADAWHVLETGLYLLLCNPNKANCISYKIALPSFLFSFYHPFTFSYFLLSFLCPSSFLPLIFSSFDHIFLFSANLETPWK